MADRSRAGIEMNFAFGKTKRPKPEPSEDAPFRMLVLGDFGAHRSRGQVRPGAELRPLRVDVDSFPSLFGRIGAQIAIRLGDQPAFTIAIKELDDFHPDHLFAALEFFAPLRKLRQQIQDPKTFALAAAQLGMAAAPAASVVTGQGTSDDEDVSRLLGRPSSAAKPVAPSPSPASIVDAMIRESVAPHIVGKPDPRQADLLAAVDGMAGDLMRAVLHDPVFQEVEATWRSLDRLVRALDLDETLQLFVLDASREEMVEDLAASPTLADSALYRIVADHAGDEPWSLLVDLHACRRGQEDAALLSRLGAIAQQVDAAVLVGMEWAGWSGGFAALDDEQAWTALRNLPAATSVAVALPGILLRLPYGKDTDPIESFTFAEQSLSPAANRYLWGSAAAAVAQLLGQSFASAGGWDFAPGDDSSIDDLPVHVTKADGETVQTPCAQVWLPESKVDALIKQGLMPLVSAQGRGEVRVPRFQSIASPPAALAGRWRRD
jgi:type VI secretion system protein ImpC